MDRPEPKKMLGSRFIAEMLKAYGVTHVFYVESILRRSLVEMASLGIRGIMAHSEKAAAYMADGYARASQGPGVCMAQSVGAANLAAGLQDAFLGKSPVVALTGRQVPLVQHRNAYQEIPHGLLFQSVTRFSAVVETPDQLPHLMRQAFREAVSGASGPTHLELMGHQGQLTETAQADFAVAADTRFTRYPAFRPEPESAAVKRAVELLLDAERPVLVAGGGAKASLAGAEMIRLAERLGLPVATSPNGKGTFPENHPLSVGVVGRYSRRSANQVVSEADLVVFVGCNTGDLVSHGWQVPKPGTAVVQIDILPAELGKNYPYTAEVLGDARVTLQRLLEHLGEDVPNPLWPQRARQLVLEWEAEMAERLGSSAVPIRPERLCKALSNVFPEDAILVSDTGYAAVWTGTLIPIIHPAQRFIRSAGSLGWGFPASIGVKCAAPRHPVVCFTGDGGFWYHFAELETARRCGIHTVTVVNNNSGFGQCLAQVRESPLVKDSMFKFRSVDFAAIAREMGCLGIRVEKPEAIEDALITALNADLPAVVDVVTDVESRPPSAWTP